MNTVDEPGTDQSKYSYSTPSLASILEVFLLLFALIITIYNNNIFVREGGALDLIWAAGVVCLIGFLSILFLFRRNSSDRRGRGRRREIGMEEIGAAAGGATEAENKNKSSYRYWVRESKEGAAPLPVPRKLDATDIQNNQNHNNPSLGSRWNHAGTWEERNLNSWASARLKELLGTVESLQFSGGTACIDGVSNCSGDAFSVTVRNKKKVNYTYELSLKFKGEWSIKEENKTVKGHLEIPEFSFGELDDLQVEIKFSDENSLTSDDKMRIRKDLRTFISPIRQKLELFEEELKDR